jgi:hypothetical protein
MANGRTGRDYQQALLDQQVRYKQDDLRAEVDAAVRTLRATADRLEQESKHLGDGDTERSTREERAASVVQEQFCRLLSEDYSGHVWRHARQVSVARERARLHHERVRDQSWSAEVS